MANVVIYTPSTFETEMSIMSNKQGMYTPNFRDSSLSYESDNGTIDADLVFDSTAFIKAFSSTGSLVEDNNPDFFFYRHPGEFRKYKNTIISKGAWYYEEDPEIWPGNNRVVPLHTILGLDSLPALGRASDVTVLFTSSNWIKVSGSQIVEFSPSITKALAAWKAKYPDRKLKNEDFFGVKPFAFRLGNEVEYNEQNAIEVDLVRKVLPGGAVGGGVRILALGVLDKAICNPTLNFTNHFGDLLVQDRGLSRIGQPPPRVETIASVRVTEVNNSLIRGTSNNPGWYVTVEIQYLGIKGTVQSNEMTGDWFYRLRPDEKAYLDENQLNLSDYSDQIQARAHENINPRESLQASEAVDHNVVRIKGCPRYVLVDDSFNGALRKEISHSDAPHALYRSPNSLPCTSLFIKTVFYRYNRGFYKDKNSSSLPHLDDLKTSEVVNENINKVYSGIRFGLTKTTKDMERLSVSFPGSIIQSCGIDIFIYTKERAYNQPVDFVDPYNSGLLATSFQHALSLTLGIYGAEDESQTVEMGWTSEKHVWETQKYTFRWDSYFEDDKEIYTLRWTNGYESRTYADTYRLKWNKEVSRWQTDEYTVRWSSKLPEDDEDRIFYDMSWKKELIADSVDRYTFKWTQEMVKTLRHNYYLSWSRPDLDEVVVKPFCIKEGERYHISYMVYGSPSTAGYLLDDSLTFYFSNPSKYELVKFNRDSEPYLNIFIKEYKNEPVLANRESIPSDYILIGNYTILDIDPKNSLSLDVVVKDEQLNEFRSYWLPEDLGELAFTPMQEKGLEIAPVVPMFRDDHHVDVVELEIEFLNESECCFKQKVIGSRCSPY